MEWTNGEIQSIIDKSVKTALENKTPVNSKNGNGKLNYFLLSCTIIMTVIGSANLFQFNGLKNMLQSHGTKIDQHGREISQNREDNKVQDVKISRNTEDLKGVSSDMWVELGIRRAYGKESDK